MERSPEYIRGRSGKIKIKLKLKWIGQETEKIISKIYIPRFQISDSIELMVGIRANASPYSK